jgi:hypothetical protein
MKIYAPNKENHQALWLWLSEHPESWKDEWPGWKILRGLRVSRPRNFCFLCREFHPRKTLQACRGCPLSKGEWRGCELSGPFYEWANGCDRSRNAEIIANCWT